MSTQIANASARLAVFVLADVSGSMAGAPLTAVQDGLAAVVKELRADAELSRGVFLSLITYGRSVIHASALNAPAALALPQLKAGGFTPLGQPLKFVQPLIAKESRTLLLILSDGQATDEIKQSARALAERSAPCVMACIKPNDWQPAPRAIPGLKVKLVRNDAAANLFKWIGETIRAAYFGGIQPDALTAFPPGVALWPEEPAGAEEALVPLMPASPPPRKTQPVARTDEPIELEIEEPAKPDAEKRAKQTTILYNDLPKSRRESKRAKPAADKQAAISNPVVSESTPVAAAAARKRGGLFDHLTGI